MFDFSLLYYLISEISSLLWVYIAITAYLCYPIAIKIYSQLLVFSKHSKSNQSTPTVYIVFAVYNEEAVIEEKIHSIFNSNYTGEIKIIIGNDNSTDNTVEKIQQFQTQQIEIIHFPGRNGKIAIINALMESLKQKEIAQNSISILTDANVIFHSGLIPELVSRMHSKIGVLSANIIEGNPEIAQNKTEQFYVKTENKIKQSESVIGGNMVGAFGGCYALYTKNYTSIPPHFICDDFYQTCFQLKESRTSEFCAAAIAYEDVPKNVQIEFRRKRRMSAGNLQNLFQFWKLYFLKQPFGVFFFFHKLLKWLLPIFILTGFGFSIYNLITEPSLKHVILHCVNLGLPFGLIYSLCFPNGIKQIRILNSIAYFFFMNLALLLGYWDFIRGKHSNIWTPTERNVRS